MDAFLSNALYSAVVSFLSTCVVGALGALGLLARSTASRHRVVLEYSSEQIQRSEPRVLSYPQLPPLRPRPTQQDHYLDAPGEEPKGEGRISFPPSSANAVFGQTPTAPTYSELSELFDSPSGKSERLEGSPKVDIDSQIEIRALHRLKVDSNAQVTPRTYANHGSQHTPGGTVAREVQTRVEILAKAVQAAPAFFVVSTQTARDNTVNLSVEVQTEFEKSESAVQTEPVSEVRARLAWERYVKFVRRLAALRKIKSQISEYSSGSWHLHEFDELYVRTNIA